MAPQQGDGKRKEEFVKWKESPQSMDRGQSHAGGAFSSVARKKKHALRQQTGVKEQMESQRVSDTEEVPRNHDGGNNERDSAPEGGAVLQRPPQVPKYVSPSKFVPPRASGLSPCIAPLPSASNSRQHNARQASSSPLGRPLRRMPQEPEYSADDETCEDPHNSAPTTKTMSPEGNCVSLYCFFYVNMYCQCCPQWSVEHDNDLHTMCFNLVIHV